MPPWGTADRIMSRKTASRIAHAATRLMPHDKTNISAIVISSTLLVKCKDAAIVAPCLL